MEHAIGERITLEDGRVVEVVEGGKTCKGCFCEEVDGIYCLGDCDACYRTDYKNIIYKEVKE